MNSRMACALPFALLGSTALFLGTAYAIDRTLPHAFREFPGIEYRIGSLPLPPDYQDRTEWTFARLMYPGGANDGYIGREADWHVGISLWTQDFPRADRHFSLAVRRLTRIHVRSVEQAVNLDDGPEVYNWPWLYAVEVGEWGITDEQAKKLRDYLLRGGFFMADDFHGTVEWQVFQESMERVFPDRHIVDIPDADPILGPEMKSTGEVMGTGRTFGEAYAKAQIASGVVLPRRGLAFISVRDRDKPGVVELGKMLTDRGFEIVATGGTAQALAEGGVTCRRVNKVREGRPHVVDMIKNRELSLIVNTTEGKQAIRESHSIRGEAVHYKVTYYTTLAAAKATCDALDHLDNVVVNRLQDLHAEASI